MQKSHHQQMLTVTKLMRKVRIEEEHAIVEPSGGESSGLIGNEKEIVAMTDESSAAPGDPQSAVSGGGENEGAGSAGEVN